MGIAKTKNLSHVGLLLFNHSKRLKPNYRTKSSLFLRKSL